MATLTTLLLSLSALFGAYGQVIIRQYIEGAGFNKAIQIQNLGSTATDVSGYVIEERVNVPTGSVLERYTFGAGTSISDVFTVCNSQASEYLLSVCNDTAAFGINGNDAISLLDASGNAVDRVGDVTGAALTSSRWEVSCVAGATADHTLVRAAVFSPPLVAWATGSNQWDVYEMDTYVDSTNTTWNTVTGVMDLRAPISTCTSSSPAGLVDSPSTTLTTPAVPPPTDAPSTNPTPPVATFNAPVVGVEAGNDCTTPPPESASERDRRLDTGALRVATYNTEFLFDGVSDPSSSRWRGNPFGATQHLETVAKFIASLDADVVNLVEVEGCSNLKSLVENGGAAALNGPYTAYLKQGTDSATGQDVALLTRVDPSEPITRTSDRSDYPLPGSMCGFNDQRDTGISKNYIAKWESVSIGTERMKLAMVGLHLKAFPTDSRSCSQREGQAAVARGIIQDLSSDGYEVVALGDINDFSVDPPDAAASSPTSMVLDMLAGTLPSGVSVPGITSTPRLYNVMEKVPQDQRYTAWYDRNRDNRDDGTGGGENSAIDHVLVTQRLWDLVSDVDIVHEAPAGVDGEVLSDHWPIVVTFGTPDPSARSSSNGVALGTPSEAGRCGWGWAWSSWVVLVAGAMLVVA